MYKVPTLNHHLVFESPYADWIRDPGAYCVLEGSTWRKTTIPNVNS